MAYAAASPDGAALWSRQADDSGCPVDWPGLVRAEGVTCAVSWLDDPLVKAAVPLAPEAVLRTLAGVGSDAPPLLTVRLTGGHVLDGGLVGVGTDRGSDVLVLSDPETGRLGYALMSSVVAVEVHNPGPFQDLLTAGRVPLPQVGEPVTKLALQREFPPTGEFPVDVDWAAFGSSGSMIGNLAGLLRGLRDAVASVCADDMGQRAWAQIRTLRVEHDAGSPLSVAPVPGGMAVQADLTAALPRALGDELARKISALL
jgi:hypothetical protein